MQLPRARRRQIQQSSRSEGPLAYDRLSDPILVTRAKDGDARALAALCERHAPRVERLARHLLHDPEDARDAAQESLAKLCVRIRQFRGESQFSTWLHRLVVNTCRDVATRQRARRLRAAARGPAGRDGRGSCARARPVGAALRAGRRAGCDLGRSGPRGRAQGRARLVVRGDLRAVGMPVGTAKCYAHRGRSRLRERLVGG